MELEYMQKKKREELNIKYLLEKPKLKDKQ